MSRIPRHHYPTGPRQREALREQLRRNDEERRRVMARMGELADVRDFEDDFVQVGDTGGAISQGEFELAAARELRPCRVALVPLPEGKEEVEEAIGRGSSRSPDDSLEERDDQEGENRRKEVHPDPDAVQATASEVPRIESLMIQALTGLARVIGNSNQSMVDVAKSSRAQVLLQNIGTYDGGPEFEEWFEGFRTYVKAAGIGRQEAVGILVSFLRGHARATYKQLSLLDRLDYACVVRALREAVTRQYRPAHYRKLFQSRMQQSDETVRVYAAQLRRLAKKGFNTAREEDIDEYLKEQFCDGCRPELRVCAGIYMHDGASFQECLEDIARYEANLNLNPKIPGSKFIQKNANPTRTPHVRSFPHNRVARVEYEEDADEEDESMAHYEEEDEAAAVNTDRPAEKLVSSDLSQKVSNRRSDLKSKVRKVEDIRKDYQEAPTDSLESMYLRRLTEMERNQSDQQQKFREQIRQEIKDNIRMEIKSALAEILGQTGSKTNARGAGSSPASQDDRRTTGKCYRCGEQGHYAIDCRSETVLESYMTQRLQQNMPRTTLPVYYSYSNDVRRHPGKSPVQQRINQVQHQRPPPERGHVKFMETPQQPPGIYPTESEEQELGPTRGSSHVFDPARFQQYMAYIQQQRSVSPDETFTEEQLEQGYQTPSEYPSDSEACSSATAEVQPITDSGEDIRFKPDNGMYVLRARLCGLNVPVFLDSGSSCSLISQQLFDSLQRHGSDCSVISRNIKPGKAVDGRPLPFLAKAKVTLQLGSMVAPLLVYVVQHCPCEFLLGRDGHSIFDIVLFPRTRVISLANSEILPLLSIKELGEEIHTVTKTASWEVVCRVTVEIPPWSRVAFMAKINNHDDVKGNEQFTQAIFEPLVSDLEETRLAIPPVIVNPQQQEIPIQVLNPTTDKVYLRAGQKIGMLSPIDCLGDPLYPMTPSTLPQELRRRMTKGGKAAGAGTKATPNSHKPCGSCAEGGGGKSSIPTAHLDPKPRRLRKPHPDQTHQLDISTCAVRRLKPRHRERRKLAQFIESVAALEATEAAEEQSSLRQISELKIDLNKADITETQVIQLRERLLEYKDIFSTHQLDVGRSNLVFHRVETGTHPPIHKRPHSVSRKEREIIESEIKNMLEQGVIKVSNSPWSAPVVLTVKKDGSPRLCIDYRELNKITVRDVYPLPKIADILMVLGQAKYFSAMDLNAGFWQIEIDPKDRQKSAFITHSGLYEFVRMPFGMTNSPATFQRCMEVALAGIEWVYALVYMDDIIVFSRTFEEHLDHLAQVFTRLRLAGLKLKGKKCQFARAEISFLGHIVSRRGVRPEANKVEAIKDFPRPTNLKQLRGFLGLAGFYRKFIPHMANIAQPLYDLLKKDRNFEWTEACQKSFEKLRYALTSDSVLIFPDFSKPFLLCTDASKTGLGAVLEQEIEGTYRPIAFASRSLNKHEQNYTVTELEALAVFWAVKYFRPYLYGHKFTILTDHSALKWLLSTKTPNGRIARWAMELQVYDFDVVHRPGRLHNVPDALSRIEHDVLEPAYSKEQLTQPDEPNEHTREDTGNPEVAQVNLRERQCRVIEPHLEKWKSALLEDEEFGAMMRFKLTGQLPDNINQQIELKRLAHEFVEEDGVLYRYTRDLRRCHRKDDFLLLCVPAVFRTEVLAGLHDSRLGGGHLGFDKTFGKARMRYYWRTLPEMTRDHVRKCKVCQAQKVASPKHQTFMKSIPARGPFDKMGLDLLTDLPITTSGNRHIAVFTDYLTKYVEIFAVPNMTAATMAKVFIEGVICRHGVPTQLLTDQGSNFTSQLFREICKKFNVQKLFTTPYHPRCNGLTERFNATLCNMLAKYCDESQRNWDELLPYVAFSYNCAIQRSTLESPFYLVHGRDPQLPLDVLLPRRGSGRTEVGTYKAEVTKNTRKAWKLAATNIEMAQAQQRRAYNKKVQLKDFNVGDKVWIKGGKVPKVGKSAKLMPTNDGPYRIIARPTPETAKLRRCADVQGNCKDEKLVHLDRLKFYWD